MNRMAIVVTALAVTGCNQIFGLDQTAIDPDSIPDARPAMCPATGVVPRFGTALTQVGTKSCTNYTDSRDTGRAIALCSEVFPTGARIEGAPIDGDFTLIDELAGLYQPRLAPEGDEILARRDAGTGFEFVSVTASGGMWTDQATLSIGAFWYISNPSRRVGGERRLLAVDATYGLHELVDAGAGWSERDAYPLPLPNVGEPFLSEDGLRLLTIALVDAQTGTSELYYADRPSIAERFGSPQRITEITNPVGSAFLTPDCGRLYITDATMALRYARQAPPP